jgi:hypothetical protein
MNHHDETPGCMPRPSCTTLIPFWLAIFTELKLLGWCSYKIGSTLKAWNPSQ